MPRPKRARQAPPRSNPKPTTEPTAARDNDDEHQGRGRSRSRTTRSTGTRFSIDEAEAIQAANQSRDAALERLANEDPTQTSGPEDTRSESIEIGRRAMATPLARRDTTGLDLADEDVFGDLGDSFADGDIPDAPHSAASSSATLSHFKTRRPRSRQSSIIGRNDPPIRPSSRGGTTPGVSSSFNIGVFRRRAREPSILGTSRRARSRTGSVASSKAGSATRDSDLESEGETFAPEAESTPLNTRRRSQRSQMLSVEREPASTESRRRSTRKRKSDENVPSEESDRPAKASRVASHGGIDIGSSDSELSDLASPSPPPARRMDRPVTPMNQDEIMAPPVSSDSEADEGIWPSIHTLAKKRRRPSMTTTPARNDNWSDISSPPSLTHSPNLEATRGRTASRRQKSPKLTTADLTNLLPKRRYKRNRDEFDIDTGAQGADEEQGSRGNTAARSARRRAGSRSSGSTVLKPKQTPASVRRSARTATKTYRSRDEDKENEGGSEDDEHDESHFQPLPDDTFDTGTSVAADVQGAEELKNASKKFKEVDRWELSFEEVAEPPSPQGAR